jgi:hypothetical protein
MADTSDGLVDLSVCLRYFTRVMPYVTPGVAPDICFGFRYPSSLGGLRHLFSTPQDGPSGTSSRPIQNATGAGARSTKP